MLYLLFNSLLYIILFLYTTKKNGLNPGSILTGLWAIVAIAGTLYYPTDSYFIGHISLWPLLYLFATFYLFARYVINYRMNNRICELAYSRSKTIDILCYVYIICVIVDVISDGLSLQQIAYNNVVENAAENYGDHFTNEREYATVWLRLTHSYESYVWYVALIAVFNSLCQGRRIFAILLLSVVMGKRLMDSVTLGERTYIMVNVFVLLALFSIYYKHLDRRSKKMMYYLATFLGIFVFSFLAAVTISRFDNSDYGVGGSFIYYLGSPMLRFDYGVADSLRDTFGGAATFNGILERFNIPPIVKIDYRDSADIMLGTHCSTSFITFIGPLCIDFGFILTFLLAIFWPMLISKLVFINGKLTLPGMYLFLFYFNRLSRGAFATGYGAGIVYYQAFIFYTILWILVLATRKKHKKIPIIR